MAVKYLLLFFLTVANGLKLQRVLVLSRHNLRTPLTGNLAIYSPNEWPVMSGTPGFLTDKGKQLESNLGAYFAEWMNTIGWFKGCPDEGSVYVYANTRQRTRETAKAFTENAFKNCNVSVYSIDSEDMDPIFNPILRNTSDELREGIVKEMQEELEKIDLRDSYLELDEILDYKNSKFCEKFSICSLTDWNNTIVYKIGEEPNVIGPLDVGNSVVDAFLMALYEGMPLKSIAWGKLTKPEQWRKLTRITKANQKVRFSSPLLAQETAKPLLAYITNVFKSKNTTLTFMFGHDSNLNPVLNSIGVKPYVLPEHNEITPLGGKLVFQKWFDDDNDRYLMKLDILYQTVDQLISGEKLSMDNPPKWASLTLKDCDNENGFCSWKTFMNILESKL